jgi:hypothetical protein
MSELTNSRPREVALTAGGRTLTVVAALLFVAGIGVGVGLYGKAQRQAADRRAIAASGVTTTGAVTRLRTGDERRLVGYEFSVDGRRFSGIARVSGERREALTTRAPIEVRYLPSNPAVNDLGGVPRRGIPIAVPFVLAPLIVGAGALCLVGVHRQRRLLTEGRVASATVIGHVKQQSSHDGTHRAAKYEFRLLSGATASGLSGGSKKPPALGSVVTVVYDPDRPARNAVYPFSLVKTAR